MSGDTKLVPIFALVIAVTGALLWLMYSADMRCARVEDAVRLCKAREGIFLYATETCVPPPMKFDPGLGK